MGSSGVKGLAEPCLAATEWQLGGQQASRKTSAPITDLLRTTILESAPMKTTHIKTLFAAGVGLAFFALAAHAQLMVNVNQTATFDNFVGGSFNGVTNNGSTNTQEVITTGLPLATPFSITYNPITGPANVTIPSGTLNTTSLTFHSTINPSQYFTSVRMTIDTDFDNNGINDLTQVYTISLSPFTAPNGFTGVAYSIIPVNFF